MTGHSWPALYAACFQWRRRLESWRVRPPASPGRFEPTAVKKALLVCTGLIGDSVMCLPAIAAARALLPGTEIVALTTESTRVILDLAHAVDRHIVTGGAPLRLRPGTPAVARRLAGTLAAERFDLAVIFLGDDYAPLLTRIAIPYRVFVAESAYRRLATHAYSVGAPASWGPAERLRAWPSLGLDPPAASPLLKPSEAALHSARARGAGWARPWMVIHAFGGTPEKWWPWSAAVDAGRSLQARLGGTVVFVGTPGTSRAGAAGPGVIDLVGQLAFEELTALLYLADCVVTTDSGPYHLAGAMCRPGVGLFRGSRPEHAGRYATIPCLVAPVPPECRRECRQSCRIVPCRQMESLAASSVVEAAAAVVTR